MAEIEKRGIPGVFIASEVFIDAARAQSAAMGFSPAAVYIPHPIQDRTDEEMKALADASYQEIINAICSG